MSPQSELIAENIGEYLKQHENKTLLRFITCGSVDDGKSTLIGRLLYDSKLIFEDQLDSIKNESKKHGTTGEEIDLALLVDGLQSEREQGITIDVAYRYFSTEKRKFIIADTPGHEQYTRNMATGASTADLAIILIDARYGVQTQTRRHSYIVSLLGIKHVVVAVNKMDLVDFSQERYAAIQSEYIAFAEALGIKSPVFVPLSALLGDNVVNISEHTPWYTGKPLMELLDTVALSPELRPSDFRFPVQYVNRSNLNFRGYCGTIVSGSVTVGDAVTVLPSRKTTKIKAIIPPSIPQHKANTFNDYLRIDEAFAPMSVTLVTEDEIDIGRGDMIVLSSNIPEVSSELEVMLVWMDDNAMELKREYLIKRASSLLSARFEAVNFQVDVNTLEKKSPTSLELNGIASCQLSLTREIAVDPYEQIKGTGSFIIIDKYTNATVGAGMIVGTSKRVVRHAGRREYSSEELELNAYVRKYFPEWECKEV